MSQPQQRPNGDLNGTAASKPRDFILTNEHRRFVEFCDASRRYRYIGVCYGAPGVGKTVSAQEYTEWARLKQLSNLQRNEIPEVPGTMGHRTVLYTVPVTASPGRVLKEIHQLRADLNYVLMAMEPVPAGEKPVAHPHRQGDLTQLIVVDEADRLSTNALEQVRDIYDRTHIGVVLIGMPGLEKRLARYPQLYSRVGFVHHFRPLNRREMGHVLPWKWQQLDLQYDANDLLQKEAVVTTMRITGGNFRLIHRLFAQIERVLEINELHQITKDVVETARESLVIGVT